MSNDFFTIKSTERHKYPERTPSEIFLEDVCDKCFFKLWGYPNLYKSKSKELCDFLVVFNNNILIFEVKGKKWDCNNASWNDWNDWKKEVIEKGITQINEAEAWIKQKPTDIFLGRNSTKKIPINIVPEDSRIFRFVIFDYGSNQTAINKLCITYRTNNKKNSIITPFFKDLLHESFGVYHYNGKKIIHFIDLKNLKTFLDELGTITDLLWYLEDKEQTIKESDFIFCASELDLLGNYILNFDSESQRHFIGYSKQSSNERDEVKLLWVERDWNEYVSSESYVKKKQADEISYTWDSIIQEITDTAVKGSLTGNSDIYNLDSAVKEMAKEPRFIRRALCKEIKEAEVEFRESNENSAFYAFSSFFEKTIYIFLFIKPLNGQTRQEFFDDHVMQLRRFTHIFASYNQEYDNVVGLSETFWQDESGVRSNITSNIVKNKNISDDLRNKYKELFLPIIITKNSKPYLLSEFPPNP
jgi:hypothetical protein